MLRTSARVVAAHARRPAPAVRFLATFEGSGLPAIERADDERAPSVRLAAFDRGARGDTGGAAGEARRGDPLA